MSNLNPYLASIRRCPALADTEDENVVKRLCLKWDAFPASLNFRAPGTTLLDGLHNTFYDGQELALDKSETPGVYSIHDAAVAGVNASLVLIFQKVTNKNWYEEGYDPTALGYGLGWLVTIGTISQLSYIKMSASAYRVYDISKSKGISPIGRYRANIIPESENEIINGEVYT